MAALYYSAVINGVLAPFLLVGIIAVVGAAYFLLRGYTWQRIKAERSFDMLILAGTLVLPMLTPFPIRLLQSRLQVQIPTTTSEIQALTPNDVLVATPTIF